MRLGWAALQWMPRDIFTDFQGPDTVICRSILCPDVWGQTSIHTSVSAFAGNNSDMHSATVPNRYSRIILGSGICILLGQKKQQPSALWMARDTTSAQSKASQERC